MSLNHSDLHLERMSEKHLAATYRWLRESPEIRTQIDSLELPTPHGNEAYWRDKWTRADREDYAIVIGRDDHVGNCGLCDIDLRRRKAQLWMYLGERRGRGHGAAAAGKLLSRGFTDLRLNRVYLRVVSTNERALKFYLDLGFVREGVARQDTVAEEKYVDSILMSQLADEYQAFRCRGGTLGS